MNKKKMCPGTSCSGEPAKARVTELQFASVDGKGDVFKFDPKPIKPGGDEYNLENNPGMPKVNGRTPPFWEVVQYGGPGTGGFGNFDVAILLDNGLWLHGTAAGQPAKLSTAKEMDDQFEATSQGPNPGDQAGKFWFDTRFWCVVCETPWKNGKPVLPNQ